MKYTRYSFHGTTEKNAEKIQKEGFKKNTWFALHLEDALEFGGEYVFMVGFDDIVSDYWQFKIHKKIPKSRIVSLKKYNIRSIK
jgi:hypothetical protein